MFKASVRPEVLKEVVDVVSTLVDEAKLTATKTGIAVKVVDPAHVAMIELNLGKAGFEEFKADDMELGVDIDKTKEVLRLAKPGELIQMEHDEEFAALDIDIEEVKNDMAYRIVIESGIEISAKEKYKPWYDVAMAELESVG